MAYCTIEEVRNLTSLTDLELENTQIQQIISDAENYINAITGKPQGWLPTDSKYPFIQIAARLYAAALCFDALPEMPETADKSDRYRSQAKAILNRLQPLIVISSEYQHIKE